MPDILGKLLEPLVAVFFAKDERMAATLAALDNSLAGATDEQLDAAAKHIIATRKEKGLPMPGEIIDTVRRMPRSRSEAAAPISRAVSSRDEAKDPERVRLHREMVETGSGTPAQLLFARAVIKDAERMARFEQRIIERRREIFGGVAPQAEQ